MSNMRPGSKIRFWSPRFKNKPLIDPPGLLRIASALCIFSIVGTLLYSVGLTLTAIGSSGLSAETAIYIVLLHFLLPLLVVYTVATNSPLSRNLITIYILTIYSATLAGKGILGALQIDFVLKAIFATALLALVLAWLYRSPKMRVYYAIITDSPMPSDLERSPEEIYRPSQIEQKISMVGDSAITYLEFAVVLLIIAACVYGFLVAY